jgi:hypothetical chaperone protein
MSAAVRAVGLDFGTTNSAIAVVTGDGNPHLANFANAEGAGRSETFRSILFFEPADETSGADTPVSVGNDAIRRYLESGGNGRLIQSLKSFLADRTFESTDIMGEIYSLGDLIAPILSALRDAAIAQFGELPARVTVGRPVHFASSANADERLARSRLDIAIRRAGWSDVCFEYEPVAAAYDYATGLERAETVLIADFGGGTSDFSIVRLKPGRGDGIRPDYEIVANDGVAIAGDAFDGRVMHHIAAPALGRGSRYRSPYGNVLPAPTFPYTRLERWHYLSMLKTPAMLARLEDLAHQSLEPAKIAAFIHVVRDDLGYYLFRAVEKSKHALSAGDSARFEFTDPPVAISESLSRAQFENWIGAYLRDIARCVDGLVQRAGVDGSTIDSVFMTGGSSFVPAVRRIFAVRFGESKLRMGNELTSVARGLALRDLAR